MLSVTGLGRQFLELARKDARNDPVEPESFRVVSLDKPALKPVLDPLLARIPGRKRLRLLICLPVAHGKNELRGGIPMWKRQGIRKAVVAPVRRLCIIPSPVLQQP